MKFDAAFSSSRMDWRTPAHIFKQLNDEFNFEWDLAASDTNALCAKYYTEREDALNQKWNGVCFLNPPYGRQIIKWIEKAYRSSLNGATVVLLIPARTDTAYWHDYCMKGEIRFIRGRLKFDDGKNSAPFPSAIVIFKAKDGHSE